MNKISIFLVLVITFFTVNSNFAQIENDSYKRVKIQANEAEVISKLNSLGIDLICGMRQSEGPNGTDITLDLSTYELELLLTEKIKYEVLIDDLVKFFQVRAKRDFKKSVEAIEKDKKRAKGTSSVYSDLFDRNSGQESGCSPTDYITPANYNLGTMGGFPIMSDVYSQLDAMVTQYPNLISAKASASSTLTTHEGRTVYFVKISDNPNVDEPEPEVLFDALHHAREGQSVQSMLFAMWYILENYGTDTEITNLVDHTEMYFVPIVNPDGYEYNRSTNPSGGGLWRKNRSDNGNVGVDLNRNYGYQWNTGGSSSDPSSSTYHGPYAFSEMETQIMKEFCENHTFLTGTSTHSHGDVVILPFTHNASVPAADKDFYYKLGLEMTRFNRDLYGTIQETINYQASGGFIDWEYGEQTTKNKILSTTPERGTAFWPPTTEITPKAKEDLRFYLIVAHFAGKYAFLTDLSPEAITSTTGQLTIGVERMGVTDGDFTVTVTPVTSNIGSVSGSVSTSAISRETMQELSFTYNLISGQLGTDNLVEFEVTLNNGDCDLYTTTIRKTYLPTVLFADDPDNDGLSNWTGSGWSTTSDAYSGTTAITESPGGNYSSNQTKELQLDNPVDLSEVIGGHLEFYAKWDIERNYDYVEILASGNGSSWNSLCGLYTKPDASAQPSGELYDGTQDNWVREHIDLSDYVGDNSVYLKFRFDSDGSVVGDGFTFDDFAVIGAAEPEILPIVWLDFSVARTTENFAELTWKTANEIGNKGFEVMRSANGKNWNSIGFVESHLANHVNQYSFTDSSPIPGINYYKLLQRDLDGQISGSKIVSINISNFEGIFFRHFQTGTIFIKSDNINQEIQYRIVNSIGQIMMIGEDELIGTMEIDISHLPDGLYIIELSNPSSTQYYSEKIILAQ